MDLRARCYLLVAAAIIAAHPALSTAAPPLTLLALAALNVVAIATTVRPARPDERPPRVLLLAAMVAFAAGNGCAAAGVGRLAAELSMAAGHVLLLAAAIAVVLRRGRNDVGGLLDVTVVAVVLGGLLWATVLAPALHRQGASPGYQLMMLVSALVLAAVLGALLRLRSVASRLPALDLLIVALVSALAGDLVMIVRTGAITGGQQTGPALALAVPYVCVGLALLHRSAAELTRPGPAPDDRLSTGRLLFLAAAMLVIPLTASAQVLTGGQVDGRLLALGDLLTVPLVMLRVGRLARQRERAERRLRHQATHDLLTGLPNRAELWRRLDAAVRRERAAGRPAVVLLFCDLNGFKAVNDRLGHLAGDALLREAAARLRAGLRAGDTLARYGGDEFVLLCEDEAQPQAAARVAEHVRRVLRLPIDVGAESVRVGISIGAVLSDGSLDADELIRRADEAMYAEKNRARAAL